MIASLLTTLCLSTTAPLAAESDNSIPALAASSGRLDTLVTAVQAANLVDALSGEGPFTVFAPTDEAFARLDDGTIEALLAEPGRTTLSRILTHHVVPGRLEARDLVGMESVETLAGTTHPLATLRGRLLVDESIVETANINASNGVVHLIDRVLLPPVEIKPLEMLLNQAIDRGVPLYNNGDPGACCAVYATALDAVILGNGWNLSERQVENIRSAIEQADRMSDDGSRAWAYRRIMDALLQEGRMTSTQQDRGATPARKVFTFDDQSQIDRWRIVLDGVMGGLSTGRLSQEGDSMLFTGETSLKNNGGFSSIRCGVPEGTFADSNAIRLRVRGDGRTWIVGTRKSSQMGGDSYWSRFDTQDGVWQEVIVPIDSMERHFFGQRAPGSITPDQVRAVEFYMYDKKAGPFSLQVDTIEGIKTSI
ncbi:MAG: CIA30 family protein [Planctomycetota bacterium]|nr:CIA30 family protein [Planctomycetota bacterium]